MKIVQLHDIINTVTGEILGADAIVQEDLSNIVDIGKEIINTDNLDGYVKKLVNHIGKVIFNNRVYSGGVPSVIRDNWEYGSILEKITSDLPQATECDSHKLIDGKDYSPDIFYQPSVNVKFFNSKVTFEIPLSFTEKQVKDSFSNVNQLNGFISMLHTSVENSMTVKLDALIMRTINNMIGETIHNELYDSEGKSIDLTKSGVKAVNLLAKYNVEKGVTLTKDNALLDSDFIKYATYTIGIYTDRISKISKLFNIGGQARFTPKDFLNVVLLSDFAKASEVFLQSTTENANMVTIPKYETVPFWQGSGTEYSFDDISSINVKTSTGSIVDVSGIIGIMFDKDCIGVTNLDRRVTTNYNPKAEFYTNFYKFDSGYYNDLNENFIVFFID